MRDVFYTILAIWIIWRIYTSISVYKTRQAANADTTTGNNRKTGETHVDYIPPTKKKLNDNDGEYVDFEEIK